MRTIGMVTRLQLQSGSLKRGDKPTQVYDRAHLLSVPARNVTPEGALGAHPDGAGTWLGPRQASRARRAEKASAVFGWGNARVLLCRGRDRDGFIGGCGRTALGHATTRQQTQPRATVINGQRDNPRGGLSRLVIPVHRGASVA